MELHQNQNTFIWKRMKLTVCVTAQYESVTMMGFKVKEFAENMLTPSTVGSLTLTKKKQFEKNHSFSKGMGSKQFSNTEHISRSNKGE